MRKIKIFTAIAVAAGMLMLNGCFEGKEKIVVGTKDYSENILLGEIFSQLLEAHTDLKVERKLSMGGTFVCFEALKNADIDLYPEYTGTALTAQLKMDVQSDPEVTYNIVKNEFDARYNIKWLSPLGFNNTYAIAVTSDVAAERGLEKCSDLRGASEDLIFGAEHEFFNRQDGYDGFIETYGIVFRDIAKMNVSLKYQAIGEGQMDVTNAFSTDGQIKQYDLKILEDDKGFFPPYYPAPIVRGEFLEANPEIEGILNMLAGKIQDSDMGELNYKVDVEQRDIKSVAAEFLKENGLIG